MLGAAGLLPPGVAFAICPGEGEATTVRCTGGGDAFGEAAPAGEVLGEEAGADGGEIRCEDGGLETAAP